MAFDPQVLNGWKYDPTGINAYAKENGSLSRVASSLIGGEQRDCYLWQALLKCKPTWRRGAQKIGDCFVAGTMVLMADGSEKPIEDVRIGERVRTSSGASREVIDTIKKQYSGTLLTVRTECLSRPITMTIDHRLKAYLESEKTWQPVGELTTDSWVDAVSELTTSSWVGAGGGNLAVGAATRVRSITPTEVVNKTVYCLNVDVEHEFIANGLTVHNCVSWGMEGAATVLMAIESIQGKMQWIEEAATEPIYGGSRVEIWGKRTDSWQDGSTGHGAAQWVKKYGLLLRLDYTDKTPGGKNSEYDLRKYSGDKAKQWGYYGCGGQQDNGRLDALAKVHPIKNVTQVQTIEECIAALTNAYPVTIASMAGFGDMRRDANGLCQWVGSWAHQMFLWAIRWRNGRPEFRICQSWGDSCSGPDPGIADTLPKMVSAMGGDGNSLLSMPGSVHDSAEFRRRLILPDEYFPYCTQPEDGWNPVSACSWWVDEKTMARILSSGDCWTYSGVTGFEPRKLDILGAITKWTDDL